MLKYIHGFALLCLFLAGLMLVYEASMWYLEGGAWLGTCALGLVGGSCLCLALFGQKNRSEGVIAATIVSAFWTMGAAVAFGKEQASLPAWTLVFSAIAQVTSSIAGAAISTRSSGEEDDFLNSPSASQAGAPRNYGALSSFIDPLSMGTRLGPSGSHGSLASMQSSASIQPHVHSPTVSPLGRTPSPFGSHNSPHRLAPTSLASLSAAAATPKDTPEDIKQSYKALWEKYDLDT